MLITVKPNNPTEKRFHWDVSLTWDWEIGSLDDVQRFVSTLMSFLTFSQKTVDSFVNCYDKW